jgi:hypothetical protein
MEKKPEHKIVKQTPDETLYEVALSKADKEAIEAFLLGKTSNFNPDEQHDLKSLTDEAEIMNQNTALVRRFLASFLFPS